MRIAAAFVLLLALSASEPTPSRAAAPDSVFGGYYPAFCHAAPYPGPSCELIIFEDGRRASLQLPGRLDFFAYTAKGTAIYGVTVPFGSPKCVYKVDLQPVKSTLLTCPVGLATPLDVAVSADERELVVSGQIDREGNRYCGIFSIQLPEGATRQLVGSENCYSFKRETSWTSLSLAPRSDKAVAVRGGRLELIDLNDGASSVVAEEVTKAAWSPDGKWIAALKKHGGTDLIDPNDLKRKRSLPDTEAQWSPDSRYLLRVKACDFPVASNGVGTVQAVNVATGSVISVESSRCLVENHSTGWISSLVSP